MHKILAVALLAYGVLLGLLQTRSLFAELYRPKSEANAERFNNANALEAAAFSVRLAPWRVDNRAVLSWRLQSANRPAEARAQFALALSRSPADAYLWAEYSQLLSAQRKFGHEMEFVTRRSNLLGPTSRAVQESTADIGLYFWARGSAVLQQEWLKCMAFMLRNDGDAFLRRAQGSDHGKLFCLGPGAKLSLTDWCVAQNSAQ